MARFKDEQAFIRAIHRRLDSRIHRWNINARFAAGVPDVWYSGPGGDLWVEYKYKQHAPKRKAQTGVTALQAAWLEARKREGRRVALVVGTPDGCFITDYGWKTIDFSKQVKQIEEIAGWIHKTVM